MRIRGYIMALVMGGSVTPFALAGSGNVVADDQYVPRLADMMSTVQLRHMKLWFAGEFPIGNSRLSNFAGSRTVWWKPRRCIRIFR